MNCPNFSFCPSSNSNGKGQIQGSKQQSKMKKLNIFSAANKKDRKDDTRSLSYDTINKIVSKKEEVKCYTFHSWFKNWA